MKYFLILTILCAVSCTPEIPENRFRFNHVMLYVQDIDASVEFYTKAFPLQIKERIDVLTRETPDGMQDANVKIALLTFENQDFLLEIAEQSSFADTDGAARHYQHLGVNVLDIETAFADLLAAGATESSPIREVRANDIRVKIAFLHGPDGELIELMQVFEGSF